MEEKIEDLMTYLLLFLAIVSGLIIWGYFIYRRFASLKNRADRAWAEIHSLLKQRYDLIPDLTARVKEAESHEKEALDKVAQARDAAMAFSDPLRKSSAENDLQQALQTLFAVAATSSGLKNDTRFHQLRRDLFEVEEKIQLARRYFNCLVRDYNAHMGTFPGILIARCLHMQERALFDIGDLTQREPVQVRF